MKRIAWIGVLVAGGLSGGCLSNGFVVPDKAAGKPVEPVRPVERPPVVAAQINGDNAQQSAQALNDEMERDMKRALATDDPSPPKK
jgi:hypothetical protein